MKYRDRIKKLFEDLLKRTGRSQTEAAHLMGISQQSLANKLARGSLRFDDVLKYCDAVDMIPIWVHKDSDVKETRHIKVYTEPLTKEDILAIQSATIRGVNNNDKDKI